MRRGGTLTGTLTVLCAALTAAGCSSGGLTIGPFELEIDVGSGVISPDDFPGLPRGVIGTTTLGTDLCDFPTEAQVVQTLKDVGAIDLSGVFSISRMELVETVLTSNTDLRSLKALQLRFVPKPVAGVPLGTVVLGSSVSPLGHGTTVVLEPHYDVDLLDLIRTNDANPAPECPVLEVQVISSVPEEAIVWQARLYVDAYITIGG